MKSKKKVLVKREIYTYAHLRNISHLAYRDALENPRGRFNKCLTSMLFSAFCLEAYLNHVGDQKVSFWNDIERKLSPMEKLKVLSAFLNFDINYGIKPFQTFREIFLFRQKLVHGKSHYFDIEEEQSLDDDEFPSSPQADWEKLINLEMTRVFFEDTDKISTVIHKQAGLKGTPFEILGKEEASWS